MRIEIRTSFVRDSNKCAGSVQKQIAEAIQEITDAETIAEFKNVKKIKGGKSAQHAYRMRIGNYRICFYYYDDVIEFVRVLPRKIVYRHFP